MSYKAIVNYYGNSRSGFHVRGIVVKEVEKSHFQHGLDFASAMAFEETLDKAIEQCLWNLARDLDHTNRYTMYPAELPFIRFPKNVIIKKNYKHNIENWRLTE